MKQYLNIIKQHIDWIKTIEKQEGQNNLIFIINEACIFRFPKHPEGVKQLKQEVMILNLLNKKLDLPIPKPFPPHLSNNKERYISYKMIQGEPFRKDLFEQVKNKNRIATTLGKFLKNLHHIPLDEIEDIQVDDVDGYNRWMKMYKDIEKLVFPYISLKAKEIIKLNFENFLSQNRNFTYQKTLTHGDFGPSNILYDKNKQMISGIIDFSEIAIDDPAIDFASMIGPFGYGEAFLKLMKDFYPEVEGYLERARFYASTFALQDALYGILHNDKEVFNLGINSYLR